MPYKRPNSPYYQIRRRSLQGYGDTGVLTTKTENKQVARRMEALLEELAERALLNPKWTDLLDAVCEDRSISLADLLKAKNRGTLDELCRQLSDPLLEEAIADFRDRGDITRQTENGLAWLEGHTPSSMRLSEMDSQKIQSLLHDAEEERKRNSVRRQQMRAISLLLRHHLGDSGRDNIFDGIHFPAEDDTREVHLLPAEIARLLDACHQIGKPLYEELAVIIRLSLQTSADRGVLLAGSRSDGEARGLLVRDVKIWHHEDEDRYSGQIHLHDQKTRERGRTVPITDSLSRELVVLTKGKGPDDTVFEMTYNALDYRWQKVRAMADLEHVRFKDLRAQTAIYGETAGIDQTTLQRTMGHSDESMTRRYQERSVSMSKESAEALENAMLPESGDSSD